ncbi:hypothetical protein STEG23_001956, partial [Scotinomys teguina]
GQKCPEPPCLYHLSVPQLPLPGFLKAQCPEYQSLTHSPCLNPELWFAQVGAQPE